MSITAIAILGITVGGLVWQYFRARGAKWAQDDAVLDQIFDVMEIVAPLTGLKGAEKWAGLVAKARDAKIPPAAIERNRPRLERKAILLKRVESAPGGKSGKPS